MKDRKDISRVKNFKFCEGETKNDERIKLCKLERLLKYNKEGVVSSKE